MLTDIEIAESITPRNITEIADILGIPHDNLFCYGKFKAKIEHPILPRKDSKVILVSAISPTSAGIGKTTISIGLADALRSQGESVCVTLREPSLGPVFGIKGGATGGGYSQIIPMADINLHFNGDFHAITSANNLLCAIIDNHIFQGNSLNIDKSKILFHRCLDTNDRALRNCVVGSEHCEHSENFSITAASEIMAIMCLSKNLEDLKKRLANILVAMSKSGAPIYARDLQAVDAMAILLKDALLPNLVQTLEGTPALVHMGPFANIAHGCSSLISTNLSRTLCEYTITEAGFGSDLGGEKFIDIKCRLGNITPNAVVLVATIQALKLHGGAEKDKLHLKNIESLILGLENLRRHIHSLKDVFHTPLVVTLNKFSSDTSEEIEIVSNFVKSLGAHFAINNAWGEGSKGTIELANIVKKLCSKKSNIEFAYNLNSSIEDKLDQIVRKVYGGNGAILTHEAKKKIEVIKNLNFSNLPIVIAKTQYSFSDNPKLIGAPNDFNITITDIELKSGAGFIVAIAGNMMLMPGLSKEPSAIKMKIDNNGKISGLN